MNNAVITFVSNFCVDIYFSSLGICLGVDLLGHMVTMFNFLRNYQLYFKVATPFSISTSKVGGFPFPHIFTTTCYYPFFFNTTI